MQKYLKSERGSSMIEAVIIVAVVLLLLVILVQESTLLSTDSGSTIVQETTPVNETPNTEKLIEGFFAVFLGFLLLTVIIATIAGGIFLTIRFHEKKGQGPQSLDDVLRFMLRKKPKKLFVLQKGTNDMHSYHFVVSKYEWLLDATASQLDIKMKIKEKQVLHITYDKTTENFTRKNVKAHAFSDEKTLKQLDKLIDAIIATEWNRALPFELMAESDDLNQETSLQTEESLHTIITDPMLELEAQIEQIIEDAETKEKFQIVIENMNLLQHYHTELDIETKHTIEYSLTNDLNRLLSLYEALNEDQKETMAEEIQARLDLMNEKVEQIQTKLDEKKASEIKKALHLFDQRYKTK